MDVAARRRRTNIIINRVNNQIYNKILSQNGLTEFKSLTEKWEKLSENLSDKPSGVPIILPDLFLVSRSGTGRTHFLRLLSEYLEGKPIQCLRAFRQSR